MSIDLSSDPLDLPPLRDWAVLSRTPWHTLVRHDTWHALIQASGRRGVVLLAHDAGDNVVLVKVRRPALGRMLWELPRGFAESGEVLSAAAVRELEEETGLKADYRKAQSLVTVAPDSGILASEVTIFACHLAPGQVPLADTREVSDVAMVPLGDLKERVAKGEIRDAFTVIAVLCLAEKRRRGEFHPPVDIEILENDEVLARLSTHDPEWALEQFTRNRNHPHARWRLA